MARASVKRGVISGIFGTFGFRRRALRASAPPLISAQYDRLDRLQSLDPFPPEGLGFRTRLAGCWHDLDRLTAAAHVEPQELVRVVAGIDEVEEAVMHWWGPTLLRPGRRA